MATTSLTSASESGERFAELLSKCMRSSTNHVVLSALFEGSFRNPTSRPSGPTSATLSTLPSGSVTFAVAVGAGIAYGFATSPPEYVERAVSIDAAPGFWLRGQMAHNSASAPTVATVGQNQRFFFSGSRPESRRA